MAVEQPAPAATHAPSAVTYAQIVELVEAEVAKSRAPTREGRSRLLVMVRELAARQPDEPSRLLVGRIWRIASVAVTGLGGVGRLTPGCLDLDPVPGLTVVRGPNGSGKTSIAKAVELSLRSTAGVGEEASGDLWATTLLADGAPQAKVEVTLTSGCDRFEIHTLLGRDGEAATSAVLTDHDGAHELDLGQDWQDAVVASRACYSYSRLQSRLQSTKDLQIFLEELLVLGPAWQDVRDELDRRSRQGNDAAKEFKKALGQAKRKDQEVGVRFRADPRRPSPLPDIEWPRVDENIEAWIDRTGLGGAEQASTITAGDEIEDTVTAVAAHLDEAEQGLSAAEDHLRSPELTRVTHHVGSLLENSRLADEQCPLCGTPTDWRAHAQRLISGHREWDRHAARVQEAIGDIVDWAERALRPSLGACVPGGPDDLVSALGEAVRSDGCRAHSATHRVAQDLLGWLASEEASGWLAAVRRGSDASAQWRRERAELVAVFLDVWRRNQGAACDADAWATAAKTLDAVQVRMRQERQDGVTSLLRSAVAELLPDAHIEIGEITHGGGARQRRGVTVAMEIGARTATLGMLSSGQRNALLLAPLTMSAAASPFGFRLVDDPIHALDDTRVDLVAAQLVRLAETHQVVVFTHDPRLEEHLRARVPTMSVIAVDRDPTTQTVAWSQHSTPWDALLKDADRLREHARSDGWQADASVESVVLGLCRNALDGAIRQTVISYAVRHGEDVEQALGRLDKKETRKRIKHVVDLVGRRLLPKTEACRDTHLATWNAGTHGRTPAGLNLGTEIAVARAACDELAGLPQ